MKRKPILLAAVLLVLASRAFAEDASLVVYNTDLGLVKQPVTLDLVHGEQTVAFTDIPARIDPSSVRLEARDGGFRLLEQDYRPDLVNTQTILRGYMNRPISIWLRGGTLVQGTLLSVETDIILRDSTGKVTVLRAETIERIEVPELPKGLVNTPTLVWKIAADRAGKTDASFSYLTGGLSWHAEYSAAVNGAETQMELGSFISIENSSGRAYENVTLKLVAGDVHRAPAPRAVPAFRLEKSVMALSDNAQDLEERAMSEYHLYEVKVRTSLPDASAKRITFFDPVTVKVQRRFVYDAAKNPTDVAVTIEFVNSEKDGPNTALPAGRVRVYRSDTDGSSVLIGEDAISHTPKNEKVRLTLGNAFDVKAERKVMDTRSVSSRVSEQQVEISLRNRKTEPVAVTAVEHLSGDWEIIQKSHEFVKRDASTVEFTVNIPSNGEMVVSYTVRFRY